MLNSRETREKFLDFFKEKRHKIVLSSSLIPEDSTVLFTTAGMQQFSLYLAGKKDPVKDFGTRHFASCQKCFRTVDIENIGDDTHHTFFEMLGNWSIGTDEKGRYFKEGAIDYALEFFVDVLGLDKNRFYIAIFKGKDNIPKDEESLRIWQKRDIPIERIREFEEENFWGPVGDTGPCGPSTEIHYDRGEKFGCGKPDCGPNCTRCRRFVELWNLVFMEYFKDENGRYQKLSQTNVDTGIGFERLVAVLQQKPSAYETDLFLSMIKEIEKNSPQSYEKNLKAYRIITDHLRGSAFLIADGILPSNLGQGYVLRRVLRRIIRYAKTLKLPPNWYKEPLKRLFEIYGGVYPEIKINREKIVNVIQNEEEKFEKTLDQGLKEFNKWFTKPIVYWGEKPPEDLEKRIKELPKIIPGFVIFRLFSTYGFPIELIREVAEERGLNVDEKGFEAEIKMHQEISRAGIVRKFGGGGEFSPKLHTATHLLHAALRKILGPEVKQMGSDITTERLRFDFQWGRKMTKEEIKKAEEMVNQKIEENLEVKKEIMPLGNALKSGALAFFKEKYPEEVNVYTIFNPKTGEVFSKEICAGPHIERTGVLGNFKIKKEESSGTGVRRIKAVLG